MKRKSSWREERVRGGAVDEQEQLRGSCVFIALAEIDDLTCAALMCTGGSLVADYELFPVRFLKRGIKTAIDEAGAGRSVRQAARFDSYGTEGASLMTIEAKLMASMTDWPAQLVTAEKVPARNYGTMGKMPHALRYGAPLELFLQVKQRGAVWSCAVLPPRTRPDTIPDKVLQDL